MRALISTLVVGSLWTSLTSSMEAAELQRKTRNAWERYVSITEERIDREIESREGFLAEDFFSADEARDCRVAVESGGVCVSHRQTLDARGDKIPIPAGMVHHWLGSVLVPNVSLDELLAWLQDYSKHQARFSDVEASRLLSRDGNVFEIFLRLKQDGIVTVEFNTEHVVEYVRHTAGKASSRSIATRIAEVENPGERFESERPVGNDDGFLWRLNSYWRFEGVGQGVIVECESIGLSRSIPFAVRWLVLPFTASIPRESLQNTLLSIRSGSAATRFGDGGVPPSPRPGGGEESLAVSDWFDRGL